MSAPTVDVEACVRLLDEAKSLLADRARNRRRAAGEAEHSAEGFQWLALANQDDELVAVAGALASALPGMGKDSERWRYMRDVAWHEARPAELPGDLAATIYRLTGGVRHPTAEHLDSAVDNLIAARAAQPEETSADD